MPNAPERSRVEIRLLGPLEALVDGRTVPVGGPQPRAVLSLLALNAGTPVTWESLVDAVWGEDDPPAGAPNTVQVYVSRLRRALAPEGSTPLIRSAAGGYVLEIPGEAVDALRFQQLSAQGHEQLAQGAPDAARETFAEALAIWRGRAFPDLDGESVSALRARLDSQHLSAQAEHAEALVALGRPGQAVAELERLVQLYPLDEGLVVRLMTALYHAGRQADALSAYGSATARLADELGVDPGTLLRQTHEAVLRQTLEPPASASAGPRSAASPDAAPVANSTATATAPRSLERLRRPRGQLVGRLVELQQALDLLADPAVRIVSVVGPGGIGKTRLALALADRIGAAHAHDRVHARGPGIRTAVVALAAVADPAELLASVAQVIGAAPEWPGQDLVELLAEELTDQRTVIVLDNVEQLAGDPRLADILVELLDRAAGLTLVLTSRIALRLRDEHQIPLGPLPVPDADESALDLVRASESVQLFVDRARAVAPDFALTSANAAAVAELCRMLDGQPLALELAAARVRVLPPQDMVRRTGKLLQLLTGGSVDLPNRQRSMRAALDGSAQLLDAVELSVFGQLSVFVGGWTLAAAEQVCECPEDVVDVLTRLVDKSLVVADGSGRLSMLDTVREYAEERLTAVGGDSGSQAFEVRRRHAVYFAEYAADVGYRYSTSPDSGRRALLDAEAGNLTAALAHAAAEGDRTSFHQLVVGTLSYWFYTGRVPQGERWLALTDASELPSDLRAQVLVVIGNVALVSGDPVRASEPLDGAVQAAREVGDRFLLARVLSIRGLAFRHTGQMTRALEHTEEALRVVRAALEADPTARRFELLRGLVQNERGEILDHLGSGDEARAMFEAYRKQAVIEEDPSHQAWALINIALNECDRGHAALARELIAAAERAAEEGGSTPIQGDAHMAAGLVELLVDGDPLAALGHEAEAARKLQSSGLLLTLPDAISLLGAALLRAGQHANAARMLAAGAAWRHGRGLVVVSRLTQNVIIRGEADLAEVRVRAEGSPLSRAIDEEAARGAAAPFGWLDALDLPEPGEGGRVEIHLVDLSRPAAGATTAP